jgi:hypothetical protein
MPQRTDASASRGGVNPSLPPQSASSYSYVSNMSLIRLPLSLSRTASIQIDTIEKLFVVPGCSEAGPAVDAFHRSDWGRIRERYIPGGLIWPKGLGSVNCLDE